MKHFIFLFSLFFAIGLSLSVKSETIMQNKNVVVVSNKKCVKYDKNSYNTIALQKKQNGYREEVYNEKSKLELLKFPDSFKFPFFEGEIWICDESTHIIYVTDLLLDKLKKNNNLQGIDKRLLYIKSKYDSYRKDALDLQKQRNSLKIPIVANTDEEKRKKQELLNKDKPMRAKIEEILKKVKEECGIVYFNKLCKEINTEKNKFKESL